MKTGKYAPSLLNVDYPGHTQKRASHPTSLYLVLLPFLFPELQGELIIVAGSLGGEGKQPNMGLRGLLSEGEVMDLTSTQANKFQEGIFENHQFGLTSHFHYERRLRHRGSEINPT